MATSIAHRSEVDLAAGTSHLWLYAPDPLALWTEFTYVHVSQIVNSPARPAVVLPGPIFLDSVVDLTEWVSDVVRLFRPSRRSPGGYDLSLVKAPPEIALSLTIGGVTSLQATFSLATGDVTLSARPAFLVAWPDFMVLMSSVGAFNVEVRRT